MVDFLIVITECVQIVASAFMDRRELAAPLFNKVFVVVYLSLVLHLHGKIFVHHAPGKTCIRLNLVCRHPVCTKPNDTLIDIILHLTKTDDLVIGFNVILIHIDVHAIASEESVYSECKFICRLVISLGKEITDIRRSFKHVCRSTTKCLVCSDKCFKISCFCTQDDSGLFTDWC